LLLWFLLLLLVLLLMFLLLLSSSAAHVADRIASVILLPAVYDSILILLSLLLLLLFAFVVVVEDPVTHSLLLAVVVFFDFFFNCHRNCGKKQPHTDFVVVVFVRILPFFLRDVLRRYCSQIFGTQLCHWSLYYARLYNDGKTVAITAAPKKTTRKSVGEDVTAVITR
jgi:hypothetical protein